MTNLCKKKKKRDVPFTLNHETLSSPAYCGLYCLCPNFFGVCFSHQN